MGKATYIGPVPPGDPMFSSGPEMFSRRESSKSSMTSPSATAGETPADSTSPSTKSKQDETPKSK